MAESFVAASTVASAETPLSYYISLATGVLLTVSELLPYISKIEGNGIIQVLTQFVRKKQSDDANLVAMQHRYDEIIADLTRRLQTLEQNATTPSGSGSGSGSGTPPSLS